MTNFSFLTIDVPGAASTSPLGINDIGQMAGSFTDHAGTTHGFVELAGHFTTVDVPGAKSTEVTGINNLGQFVGDYTDGSGVHGFLESFGHITRIDMPDATATYLGGINDFGQIVGTAPLPATGHLIRQVAFLDDGGKFSTINVPGYPDGPYNGPGGTYMWGEGINDRGQITITVHNAPGSFSGGAYIDDNGTFTQIAPPDAVMPPVVGGINNLGVVTGSHAVAPPSGSGVVPQVGYVDDNGTFSSLTPFGSDYVNGYGINDWRQVVGTYDDAAGHTHGFLATPEVVPLDLTKLLGALPTSFLRG